MTLVVGHAGFAYMLCVQLETIEYIGPVYLQMHALVLF